MNEFGLLGYVTVPENWNLKNVLQLPSYIVSIKFSCERIGVQCTIITIIVLGIIAIII